MKFVESPEEKVTNPLTVLHHSYNSYSRILLPPKKLPLESCQPSPYLAVEETLF